MTRISNPAVAEMVVKHGHIHPELREQLGSVLREAWVYRYLQRSDSPLNPNHLAPWEELDKWDQETDRVAAEWVLVAAFDILKDRLGITRLTMLREP